MNLAQQMRIIAEEAKENVDISKHLEKIKTAASQGSKGIQTKSLSEFEKAKLEKEGFKVENHYDQREGDSWSTITW